MGGRKRIKFLVECMEETYPEGIRWWGPNMDTSQAYEAEDANAEILWR
jgi:hypothetical protein